MFFFVFATELQLVAEVVGGKKWRMPTGTKADGGPWLDKAATIIVAVVVGRASVQSCPTQVVLGDVARQMIALVPNLRVRTKFEEQREDGVAPE